MTKRERELRRVQDQIIACELCPRLRQHCINIGIVKRRAYREGNVLEPACSLLWRS